MTVKALYDYDYPSKDRQELFAGANVIQLGRHQFLVNTQELDLTVVPQGDEMCLHLTGTNFFDGSPCRASVAVFSRG